MPIIPPTLAVPGPCYPRGSWSCLGPPFVTSPALLSLPLSFLALLGRLKRLIPFPSVGFSFPVPVPRVCGERQAEVVPTPQRPAPYPGLLVSVLPARRQGSGGGELSPLPTPKWRSPCSSIVSRLGWLHFRSCLPPPPSSQPFSFLLLLASPSLSNNPPLPTPRSRFPPPPQTPSSGPWDAGELWWELPVSISKRGAAGSGEAAVTGGAVGGLGRRWLTEGGGVRTPSLPIWSSRCSREGAAPAPCRLRAPRWAALPRAGAPARLPSPSPTRVWTVRGPTHLATDGAFSHRAPSPPPNK